MKSICAVVGVWVLCTSFAQTSFAHEFWIDGAIVDADEGAILELDLKVGQKLDGVSLPYIADTIDRFEWVQGGKGNIVGRLGDLPAAQVALPTAEHAVIFHRTKPRRLIHTDWEKFKDYVRTEGSPEIVNAHLERGLPLAGFEETYSRHAKLVVLNEGADGIADRYLGSPLELVLETVERSGNQIELAGRLMGQANSGPHQISIFETTPNGVRHGTFLTEADGRFKVATQGSGPLLLSAVRISQGLDGEVAWHSDWASTVVIAP